MRTLIKFIFYAIEVCLFYILFKTYGYEWKAALLLITISLLSFVDGYWRALNKRK